jgi:hypothetical protein
VGVVAESGAAITDVVSALVSDAVVSFFLQAVSATRHKSITTDFFILFIFKWLLQVAETQEGLIARTKSNFMLYLCDP